MDEKFNQRYRVSSARAYFWDYSSNGNYFITICTKDREHFFGEIINRKMNLSDIGRFAQKCWYEIPQHFPFVKLDAFVVMPNHIHGIIIIDKNDDNECNPDNHHDNDFVETQNIASLPGRKHFASLQGRKPESKPKNQFGPQSKNLASIVRGFKIGVTKHARLINPNFAWQSRYHDHIIRNESSYSNITNYIINNPINWKNDMFHQR